MKPPYAPSLTPTWHNTKYKAIDAEDPRLSVEGKTVVIAGCGTGIGRATAIAFSKAKAKHVALIGRTKSSLDDTVPLIDPHTTTSVHQISVIDKKALREAAAQIGTWHVLVFNAVWATPYINIRDVDDDAWWEAMEINIRGLMLTAKSFMNTACDKRPVFLNVSTSAIIQATELTAGLSNYVAGKFAGVSVANCIMAENPDWFVTSYHPGIIATDSAIKVGAIKQVQAAGVPLDDVSLASNYAVWLASEESSFLNGKYTWANWDVDEMKSRAGKIKGSQLLTPTISGWYFPYGIWPIARAIIELYKDFGTLFSVLFYKVWQVFQKSDRDYRRLY